MPKFDPQALTETLRSGLFARYVDMVLALDAITFGFSSWAEDCPCHGKLLQHYRARRFTRQLRRQCFQRPHIFAAFGPGTLPCPMQGKRAPELATSRL